MINQSPSKILSVLEKLEKESQIEQVKAEDKDKDKNDLMLAITKDTGKFLNILTTMINAKNILEIGTSTGYSTLWFALSLYEDINNKEFKPSEKKIITIENNPLKVKRAIKNFEEADSLHLIKIIEENALDFLDKLSIEFENNSSKKYQPFDIIFLDADKENMIKYFDLSLPMVKKGGLIVADNILLPEEYKAIMSEYRNHVKRNNSVKSVTVPIGFGEEVTLKIK